jgi:hypothetical protein
MVLVLATAVAVIAFSLLDTTITASRIAEAHVDRLRAESTAEALLEYGVAQLVDQFETKTSFTEDELQPENDPLLIPDSAENFFAGSKIDLDSLELRAGVLPSGEWVYISPVDLLYEYDELAGKIVFSREVELYSKATVISSSGREITAYLNETFVVRDAPLFTNAIFYNSDLELNPGFDSDFVGPVHANGDFLVGVNSGYELNFYGKVTAVGDITLMDTSGGDGTISFASSYDPDGDSLNDKWTLKSVKSGGSYLDSNSSNWLDDATDRWNGYVQDSAMEVSTQNVVAFSDYTADDPYTAENERDNSAYAIIEPLLPSEHEDRKSDSIRNQKMAYKAGLVIKLEPGGVFAGYAPERENPSSALSPLVLDENGDVKYTAVTLPADLIGDPDDTFTSIENNQPEYYAPEVETTTTSEIVETMDEGGYETQWVWNEGLNNHQKKNKNIGNSSYGSYQEVWVSDYVYVYEDVTTTTETGYVESGLYDHREDRKVDTVAIDIERLKHYIDTNDNSPTGFDGTFDVETQWNGVVYIEFPTSLTVTDDGQYAYGTSASTSNVSTNDYHIVSAVDSVDGDTEMALMIIDAKEIPEPSDVEEEGFTLASNAPTYLVGSFNADGVVHDNDSTEPDDVNETAAAIIVDSLTLLSDNWGSNRRYSLVDGRTNISKYRPANSFVEIAAAIVTGSPSELPTDATYPTTDLSRPNSLGVINLPRFLEYWGSDRQVTIRGSLVSLFESEVRPDGAPSNFNDYYVPPSRDWGYNTLFGDGVFPPGTPVTRNYRRIDFSDITKAEYDAAIADLDDL